MWKWVSLIKWRMLCTSIVLNNSSIEEATNCLLQVSLKSEHSTRMCFAVSGHWQVMHSGWSAPDNRVWRILSLIMTTSRRDMDDFYWWPPTVGLIACNLFPVQLFQNCCHFSEINIVTRETRPAAGIFMGVTRRERADFAAVLVGWLDWCLTALSLQTGYIVPRVIAASNKKLSWCWQQARRV